MNKLIKLFSFISFAFSSCAQDYKSFDEMANSMAKQSQTPVISVKDLRTKLLNSKSIIILDAREENEYNVSHIPNAIRVGYDDFDLSKVKHLNKESIIVVYCSVGYRSGKIGDKLKANKFTSVFNLYGGIFDWKNQGEKVVDNKNREVNKVHPYNKKWGKWLAKEFWSF